MKLRLYTFGIFDDDGNVVKIYGGAMLTFNQAWKRCEVFQVRYNNPNIQFA